MINTHLFLQHEFIMSPLMHQTRHMKLDKHPSSSLSQVGRQNKRRKKKKTTAIISFYSKTTSLNHNPSPCQTLEFSSSPSFYWCWHSPQMEQKLQHVHSLCLGTHWLTVATTITCQPQHVPTLPPMASTIPHIAPQVASPTASTSLTLLVSSP